MDRRQFIGFGAGAVGMALAGQTAVGQESTTPAKSGIAIRLTSVVVDDQAVAEKFYTEKVGFVKKQDFPIGGARWLTVVAADDPDGTELLLEPAGFPPSVVFRKALVDAGIPWTAFEAKDVAKEVERMTALGVTFKYGPTKMGTTTVAVFDDTCGNLIQLYHDEPKA